MKNIYQLLRINHYIKNFIIFAPLLFTERYNNTVDIINVILIFILFCLIASAVYIFNDIHDLKLDKLHPKKIKKPIASSKLSKASAYFILIILLLFSFGISYVNPEFYIILVSYLLINIFYTIFFKKIYLLDIFVLASNYVIRVFAGCIPLSVDLSYWMAITVFFGALCLSAIKRKQELLKYGFKIRPVLKEYSIENLKNIILICQILTIVFYSLYIIFLNEKYFLTIPIVTYAIFRYLKRSEDKNFSESPVEEILKDKQNFLLIFIWLLMIIFLN